MSSSVHHSPEPAPIVACTISRDVQNFDLLIEDMEAVLGETWGDLGFGEALAFFAQPDADALEFVAIAMDQEDEDNLVLLGEIIHQARSRNIRVILIAEDVSPASLHQLLRQGADEFVPYPLPENELEAAIQRIRQPEPAPVMSAPATEAGPTTRKSAHDREGVVMAVQGLAGGVGATTFAVNLAWELCNVAKKGKPDPRVCILDLDLQYGSISTFLDLPRREAVFELLSDTESMDGDSFTAALIPFEEKLNVLTSPADMLPLDLVTSEDINRIIAMARQHFDYVVIDMPRTLVQWTEAVLNGAHIYFALLELDMRSAQNALRLKRALQAEDLPFQKLRFALNRSPGFTDLSGKSRVKRMAESLGISIDLLLPDGGKAVTQGADHGLPLALSAAKNPLRKEIAKLALSLHQLGQSDVEAA
ncbi:MAG: AAA family ATPase [Paracoccaceae bacterium]|jgi:pilus assembly protein CpaE|uniref:AAA family ATPase n=1 Tax=unclassified Seohaeicola TaxID=2641111 RepID=UPI00237C1238|nr:MULTISPECIES: AAA family ATPase [unclassified Seohaeicola]MDD9708145.1 AAA family ATPase [Seohaeicola sp. 4SK31]MDD9736109.1 AAA family ATPase [Seohaeicola sp. SP36]MDF1707470.1 AAA family ATPase [Paracoccaceae bacterium]MDM7968818.1 AAA family ATPase [Paracoccaceae bacterium]